MYGGYSMNMRKLSLSLFIVAGLMNSTWCTAGDQIVTEQELGIVADLLHVKNQIIVSPEYLAVRRAIEEKNACIKKTIEVYISCVEAQGNAHESVELRLAIDEQKKAEETLIVALEQWELKTGLSAGAAFFIVSNESAFK